jgi:solute carrier family 12 (sodium/potassium/chloride transporter), member 2
MPDMSSTDIENRKLGSFEGVFVPTTLTILGVILFTRTGWVVGNLGLGGAILVLLGAFLVSVTTAFSICSIASNIRLGAGGAFSLLTRTLGIEAGGSIGLALYFSQTLATVLYIFGFREGWLRIFPSHSVWLVDFGLLAVIIIISSFSARAAFRLQYGVLLIVAGSVLSVFLGLTKPAELTVDWWHQGDASFLIAFAVFFPAVTGILAGVNLSGELKDPKKNLAEGLKWSLLVTCSVYLGFAAVAALATDGQTLREDELALLDIGLYSPVVTAGLLAATFSSALNSLVGAPRILQALADFEVVPKSDWLRALDQRGEPKRALFFTSFLVTAALFLRDLNTVAPLITLFFLLTYGTINATLWVQQGLRNPQFRPTFTVPILVPIAGTCACLFAMFVVSKLFFFVSWACVISLYLWLERRGTSGPFGQVRRGLLSSLLRWSVSAQSDRSKPSLWQNHFLVPVFDLAEAKRLNALLVLFGSWGGSVSFLHTEDVEKRPFEEHCEKLRKAGLNTRSSTLDSPHDLLKAVNHLEASFLPPNLLAIPVSTLEQDAFPQELLNSLYEGLERLNMGLWFVHVPAEFHESESEDFVWKEIIIWIDAEPPMEARSSLDLVVLSAWRLSQQEGCTVRFRGIKREESPRSERAYLERLQDQARISNSEVERIDTPLLESLGKGDLESLHFVVRERPHDWETLLELTHHCPGFLVLACLSGQAECQ